MRAAAKGPFTCRANAPEDGLPWAWSHPSILPGRDGAPRIAFAYHR